MPELPEVETIRRDLCKKILNQKILVIKVLLPRIVKNNTKEFRKELIGSKITSIDRTGKLLVFKTNTDQRYMLVHLKMTGQLIYQKGNNIIAGGHSDGNAVENLPNRHTRVIFEFKNNSFLFFNDLRTFGYLEIVDSKELDIRLQKFGVDPIKQKLNIPELSKKIKKRKTSIKAILLDQGFISGIGNIYADEILFRAGVRPTRIASSLKVDEIKKILLSIKPILNQAIKYRGTTFNNYVDAEGKRGDYIKRLKVYGRAGEQCRKCTEKVKKIKLVGRGTHFCSSCQK